MPRPLPPGRRLRCVGLALSGRERVLVAVRFSGLQDSESQPCRRDLRHNASHRVLGGHARTHRPNPGASAFPRPRLRHGLPERDGRDRMHFPNCGHTTLQARRTWSLTGAMAHVEEERPSDGHRNGWIIEIVGEIRNVGSEERRECVASDRKRSQCRAGASRQSGDLHRQVYLGRLRRSASDDEMEVIVGLAARCVQEGFDLHVRTLLFDPLGGCRGRYLGLVGHHFVVRHQRLNQRFHICERLGRSWGDGELRCLAGRAGELIACRLRLHRCRHCGGRRSAPRQDLPQRDGRRRRLVIVDLRRSKDTESTTSCDDDPARVLDGVGGGHAWSREVQLGSCRFPRKRDSFGLHHCTIL